MMQVQINEEIRNLVAIADDNGCEAITLDKRAVLRLLDEVDRLERERDGAHKAADWNMQVVADRDAEIERLKDEVKTVREGIQKAKGMLDEGIPSGGPVHPVSAYLTTLAVRLGEALRGERA